MFRRNGEIIGCERIAGIDSNSFDYFICYAVCKGYRKRGAFNRRSRLGVFRPKPDNLCSVAYAANKFCFRIGGIYDIQTVVLIVKILRPEQFPGFKSQTMDCSCCDLTPVLPMSVRFAELRLIFHKDAPLFAWLIP